MRRGQRVTTNYMNKTFGAICGGVISETQHRKNVKEYGVWADTMSWIMRDDKYEEYIVLREAGKRKQAARLFDRYAISQI